MASSVYSYVLNLIRLGKGQVESFRLAKTRFKGLSDKTVMKQWLSAWAGRYVADFMEKNVGDSLLKWLRATPKSANFPNIDASPAVIATWLSTLVDSPYDIQMNARVRQGRFTEYGTWRFGAEEDDTYSVWQKTLKGIIVKEYLRGDKGDVELLSTYLIGQPKP